MLEAIEKLIREIGAKHGAYCHFTMQSGHTPDGKRDFANSVVYETYIDKAIMGTNFVKTKNLAEVFDRFNTFLKIDDLTTYNKEIAFEKLGRMLEEKTALEEEIAAMNEVIKHTIKEEQ